MPNKRDRHKLSCTAPKATGVSKPAHSVASVKDVLARHGVSLTGVTQQAIRQNHWREWLGQHLPEGLMPHLSGVVEREGALVIFAESAAWSARLRYAVQELDTRIRAEHPQVTRISVRVMPRNSDGR